MGQKRIMANKCSTQPILPNDTLPVENIRAEIQARRRTLLECVLRIRNWNLRTYER
ncbi:hypothetical protein B0J17DRAFT_657759 [Rhizoctonia solani]|nr:hypothetical protein B0J17DRAFT_657759 [Rhizoctonia solani]